MNRPKDAGTGGLGKESPCDIDVMKNNGSDDPLLQSIG